MRCDSCGHAFSWHLVHASCKNAHTMLLSYMWYRSLRVDPAIAQVSEEEFTAASTGTTLTSAKRRPHRAHYPCAHLPANLKQRSKGRTVAVLLASNTWLTTSQPLSSSGARRRSSALWLASSPGSHSRIVSNSSCATAYALTRIGRLTVPLCTTRTCAQSAQSAGARVWLVGLCRRVCRDFAAARASRHGRQAHHARGG